MIETERLVLRLWKNEDAAAMLRLGQDARVMEFLGPLMDGGEARALVAGQIVNQSLFGHCFWPIERRADAEVLGFCGINPLPKANPLEGQIEIGWRLAHDAWGKGYAREAAMAVLDWAWAKLDVEGIVAMTVPANTRSRALMERLGMRRVPNGDFDHPDLADGDPLRRHVLYRIERPAGVMPAAASSTAG